MRYSRNFIALFILALMAGSCAAPDQGNEVPLLDFYNADWTPQQAREWQEAEIRLNAISQSTLTGQEKCEASWKLLWLQAKAGNLQARHVLWSSLKFDLIVLPGLPDDKLSRSRRDITLMFYSRGAPSSQPGWRTPESSRQPSDSMEKSMYCLSATPSQQCAQLAVEEKLIPSFGAFAAEIDRYFKAGGTVKCDDYQAGE